jgi:hypothetical protein
MDIFNDDIFGGTPENKYFDVIFNANRNLVEQELGNVIHKLSALELLLEEVLGEDKDVETIINNYIFNNQDKIRQRQHNIYIESMGNILSQNE